MKRLAFNGGEITPAMALRSDMDVFPRSCTNLTNFDVLATGGISRRKGFETIKQCDDNAPTLLIPFVYSDDIVYLIEIIAGHFYIYNAKTNEQVMDMPNMFTASDIENHKITWQQINSILLICTPSAPLWQIKLNNDFTWTLTDFQFKCPPWQTLDLRDHEISITPSTTKNRYTVSFNPAESATETTPAYGDLLRASYYIPTQTADSGNIHTGTIKKLGALTNLGPESQYYAGDKFAVRSTFYTTYVCVKDFDGSIDFTPGFTLPENYMAAGDERFIVAENIADLGAVPKIDGISATSTFKKGEKFMLCHGYWKFYTCIRNFIGSTDHISSQNYPENYPAHFIPGIACGNALPCRGTWKFHCTGTWYGSYEVRRCYDSADLTALWETLGESYSPIGSPENNILTGDEADEECYLRLFITKSRYLSDDNISAGWPAPSCQNQLIVSSYKHDMHLQNIGTQYMDISPIISELDSPYATNDWSWCAFNSRYGFPTLACVHESRLVLASTKTQPQTIWMSRTDDLNNFQTGKLDTSALHLTMSTTTQADICWLLSRGEVIMLGTEDGEWVISSSSGQGLTPTTARIINHGRVGSAHIPAVQAIDRVLYCERGSGRLYEYGFDWASNSYTSKDLTIFADHIASSSGGITSGTMQRKPYPRAIFTLANGSLALMTYNTHHEVNAWHRYTTNGKFESICALPNGTSEDKLYAIVNRNGTRYLECLSEDSPYIDAGQYDYTSTVSTTALWPPDADEQKTPTAPLDAYITTPTPAANITVRTSESTPYSKINHTGSLTPGWTHLIASSSWTNRPHFSLQITGPYPFTILALQQ